MGDKYAATGSQNVTTATPGDTSLILTGKTTTRGNIYDIIFSFGGTPADSVLPWQVLRFATADGTGTAVTENALDKDAPVALITAEEDLTTEPTYTADTELLHFDINLRATFRWVSAPGGGLWIPAVATEGIGAVTFHGSYTGSANVGFHWEE